MPNGGSDCCGTCCFNQKNKGQSGHAYAKDPGEAYCVIRHTKIETPFWTYCTNHPHHNPEKVEIPIGPVFVRAQGSKGRAVWQPSPDSEEIRLVLLKHLDGIEEQPKKEYYKGFSLDEMVVWQIEEFREKRALAGLERIARFDPAKSTGGPFNRTRERLVNLAREAREKING
jgi:hypothetical protein